MLEVKFKNATSHEFNLRGPAGIKCKIAPHGEQVVELPETADSQAFVDRVCTAYRGLTAEIVEQDAE